MGGKDRLRVRLLGELRLERSGGHAVTLPASRKTRALLGYLIATGRAHRRERLCDLLWDGPDDPRAELRWSLSKIRPLLDGGTGVRLAADREGVGIELGGASVDLASVGSLVGDSISAAPTDALKQAAALFGGEFLDGLDLPLCYRYQEWCMAEREAASRLKLDILATLVERLRDDPADALCYAHALVMADPLSEAGHAAVVRLLSRQGRGKEALRHYEHARRMLESELATPALVELEEAGRALRSATGERAPLQPLQDGPDRAEVPASLLPSVSLSIGRDAERAAVDGIIATAAARRASDVVLVTGEPGIGKSHLLAHIGERMMAAGGRAFAARAFEAEASRSYGIWIDLLRAILRERPTEAWPRRLGLLMPELDAAADGPADRNQLFDAVVAVLRQWVLAKPTAITLDDIQWIDEASASLLHYVARQVDVSAGLLIACAARAGEIDDNVAASRALRSLERDGRLQTIALGPLDASETAELVGRIDPALDAARIFAESDGNPLFTLELARSCRTGGVSPGRTIEAVIAGQLARLADPVRETLLWAAAHGGTVTLDDLGRASHLDAPMLLTALGELERRGLVRARSDGTYDFAHDLVRQAVYRTLSQPRRKLLHRHIARSLNRVAGTDAALAAQLVHHAALAEDDEMAAHGCVLAGEQALRLFANADAAGFAERGLRHAGRLAQGPTKLEVRMALLRIRVFAATGPGLRSLPPMLDAIAGATREAEEEDLGAVAATGHHLLSVLHQEAGDVRRAEHSTLRAAEAGRAAGDAMRARQLANTARCLLELETEVGRSRALIDEAGAIADALGLDLCELYWARGLLKRWDGCDEEAASLLSRAHTLARQDQDRWREYKCLTWLAMLDQERGRYAAMRDRCNLLQAVASRLQEDEAPFVETLQALGALASGNRSADAELARALDRLRAVDDKSYLAYALNAAARLYRRAGRHASARRCATEAMTVASIMQRTNEIAIAQAMLARAGTDGSAPGDESLRGLPSGADDLSARARSVLEQALHEVPTVVSTRGEQKWT